MEYALFCRCGCGQRTATVKLPPGSPLKDQYLGYVTGHAMRKPSLIDLDMMRRQRRAALLVTTAKAMGVVMIRIGGKGGKLRGLNA